MRWKKRGRDGNGHDEMEVAAEMQEIGCVASSLQALGNHRFFLVGGC